MGKKKNITENNEEITENLEDKILKEFKDCITNAEYVKNLRTEIVNISPKFDIGLSGGIPFGSFVIISGKPGQGKMQDIDSLIMTPNGPKKLKYIKRGDIICTPNGSISRIEEIFDHGEQDLYKVVFHDKTSCKCGLEHLWQVKKRNTKTPFTISLKEIIATGLKDKDDSHYIWTIPISKPVFFLKRNILIHPYVLGCLLGDGCITKNISFTSADIELVNKINYLLDDGYYFKSQNGSKYGYRMVSSQQKNKYKKYLEKYKLLGTNSHTKFIPKDYLYNSVKNRWFLLKGLMDTDGCMNKDGTCEYSSTSLQLIKDVKKLVQSLGGLAWYKQRITKCNGKNFTSYRCIIRFKDKYYKHIFSLKRKKKIAINKIPHYGFLRKRIIDIIPLGKKHCKCIKITDNKGLYLTNNYIVTHNSSLSLQIAASAQQLPGKHKREVFYFDIEGRIKYKDLIGNIKLDLADDKFKLIQSKPGNILTGDQFIDLAEKLVHAKPGCIFILDSLSAICTKGKQEADIKDRYRDDANLLLSSFCKRISQVVAINQSIIIGICHLIADPGPSRSQWTEAGGNKIKYAADVKIMGTYFQPWEVNKTIIGQITHWKIDKSALGPPFGEVSSYIRYGYGFDDHTEILDLACDIGIIKKSGAWFSYKDLKFQGLENLRSGILETPDIFNEIKKQIELIFFKKS